ncbi:AcrR family transcriptional regulator [Frigoribacterium sp. PvP054]|uniref:TetR/AcrR family transcriptional regulator n=1 Tax=Frigoribacterium sp. PvP054 TaxID=3156438 RepID=UPI00339B27F0
MSDGPGTRPRRPVGRPRRSSAEMLADAAAELFLENGYARTTVDDIARRAGVSRGTFFNYFEAKSDLFWLDLDQSLADLGDLLRASSSLSPVRAVEAALVALAEAHDPERVPWALTQSEAMALGDDLVASAAVRFVRQQAVVASYVAERTGRDRPDLSAQVVGSALIAAASAAVATWARAGVSRGDLGSVVAAAVGPVADGLAAREARSA